MELTENVMINTNVKKSSDGANRPECMSKDMEDVRLLENGSSL